MIPCAILLYAFSAILVISGRKMFRGPGKRIGLWAFMGVATVAGLFGTLLLGFAIYLLTNPLVW